VITIKDSGVDSPKRFQAEFMDKAEKANWSALIRLQGDGATELEAIKKLWWGIHAIWASEVIKEEISGKMRSIFWGIQKSGRVARPYQEAVAPLIIEAGNED
jgi:hypothetical protein